MGQIDVPGPEPEWEAAASCQGGKRNPALQYSLWECAVGGFRLVAGLAATLESLASRLRLHIEHSWEDPGPVDVAIFRIGKTDFALSQSANPQTATFVWASSSTEEVDEALDILLEALGLGRGALTFRGDVDTGFEDLRS